MSYQLLIPKLLEDRRLILGLGSGRCGTSSLSHLLNIQEDTEATHEYHAKEPFELSNDSDTHHILFYLLDILGRESKIIADVSHYWLRYINLILAFKGDIRFICLKRDKDATIKSFLDRPVDDKNPMVDWSKEKYDRYYNEYYMKVDYYLNKHPDIFGLFDIEDLNSREGQRKMLDFLGFKNHIYDIGIKLNRADAHLEVTENSDGVVVYALNGERAKGDRDHLRPSPLPLHP